MWKARKSMIFFSSKDINENFSQVSEKETVLGLLQKKTWPLASHRQLDKVICKLWKGTILLPAVFVWRWLWVWVIQHHMSSTNILASWGMTWLLSSQTRHFQQFIHHAPLLFNIKLHQYFPHVFNCFCFFFDKFYYIAALVVFITEYETSGLVGRSRSPICLNYRNFTKSLNSELIQKKRESGLS